MSARRGVWAIVLLLTLVGAAVFWAALALQGPRPRPAAPVVLVWDVPETIIEGEPPRRLFGYGWLRRTRPTVLDAVRALDRAAVDHRVKAIVLHIDGLDWGWAKLSEIRDAVTRVRKFGKPVYAVIETGGDAEYFLASAANVVAVPPATVLQIDGLMASAMFFKGSLDKLDIRPNFAHAGAYKSAPETYTRSDLSEPAREALNALLDDLFTLVVDSLATARGLGADSVRRLIDAGPFPSSLARRVGLADTVAYTEQIDSLAVHRGGDGVETQSFAHYTRRAPWSDSRVAFVSAVGTIASGRSRYEGFDGMVIGDKTLCETLNEVREDHSVKAVLLRIDSPGGDAIAADHIWHEVRRLNARKPVIVSMSDLAASGGYYIAAPATRIVAQPGTLTGSIGVYAGKLNVLGLYRKLGLTVETLSRGRNAQMLSSVRDFNPEERQHFQAQIDTTYRLFLRRVSDGRLLTVDQADSVGQGRVWSGEAAISRSLVDTLGGIRTAWRIALRSAGLPQDQQLSVEEYPPPSRTFLSRLFESWLTDESSDDMARSLTPAMANDDLMARSLSPVMHAWLAAASFPAGRMLAVLPWSITIR